MRESRTPGSVRGAASNRRPYRDRWRTGSSRFGRLRQDSAPFRRNCPREMWRPSRAPPREIVACPGLAAKSAGKAAEIDGGAWRSDPDRRRHGLYPPPGVVHGKTAVVLVSRRGAEIGQWIGLRCVPDCYTFGISGLIPELTRNRMLRAAYLRRPQTRGAGTGNQVLGVSAEASTRRFGGSSPWSGRARCSLRGGETLKLISPAAAAQTYAITGSAFAGWFQFQPLYARIVKEQPDLLD